jgi:uncharacterized protein (DUF1800 family)
MPPVKRKRYRRKVVSWIDNGDGTNYSKTEIQIIKARTKPAPKIAPRPVPQGVPERNRAPADLSVYQGKFGRLEAKRLLDRAGFGPNRGQAIELAQKGLRDAVYSLTRPQGEPVLIGSRPHPGDGSSLDPDKYGHDHLFWLDRMVRTNQPLVERLSLVFHDWFATSIRPINELARMEQQIDIFRKNGFGSFRKIAKDITIDPAMLLYLNGVRNNKRAPNENYAREFMELFTLGADRGAYTETDIREAARALTGWYAIRVDYKWVNFHFDLTRHDTTNKTIFGKTGNYNWEGVVDLCIDHPLHASFFVDKLWSYFIPTKPNANTKSRLISIYKQNNHQVRPVLEAILMHPDFYLGPRMVKPPVVYLASLLRARSRGIDTEVWSNLSLYAGQKLYAPPNVSGWDDERWLDTSTMRARWSYVDYMLRGQEIDPKTSEYSATETPQQALNKALQYWDWPPLNIAHRKSLLNFASNAFPVDVRETDYGPLRATRQNALRQLVAINPDLQLM